MGNGQSLTFYILYVIFYENALFISINKFTIKVIKETKKILCVSGVQQWFIYIYIYIYTHTYIYILFYILSHCELSQDIEYTSL